MKQLFSMLILSFSLLMLSFSTNAQTKNPCKELSKTRCETSTQCNWVKGYTRKDGVTVSPHCRKASKKSKKNKATKNKKKSTNQKN